MNWKLFVTGPARKQLRRLPAKDRARVSGALLEMQRDPFSGDLARLTAQPAAWRRRVGSYRILFDVEYGQMSVVETAVLRRTSTTY